MDRIVYLEPREQAHLFVRFEDGTEGEVDLRPLLRGPMFEPLKDPVFFSRVQLASYGAPLWPNGLDLAPDGLYALLNATSRPTRAAAMP